MRTIRELRHTRGWTQFDLAIKVGVQPQTIYLWESGRRAPRVALMRKLGQLFEMSSDEIRLEPSATAPQATDEDVTKRKAEASSESPVRP